MTGRGEGAPMDEERPSRKALGALYAAWGLPVAQFVLAPSYEPPAWPAWLAVGVSMVLGGRDARLLAIALPFAAMLSPLAHAGRIAGLLPSEVLLVFALVYCVRRWATGALGPWRSGDGRLGLLALVAVLSYLLSFEYQALLPATVNWLSIAVVFAATRTALRTGPGLRSYLASLLVVGLFAAAIVAAGFVNGMQLGKLFVDVDAGQIDAEGVAYLFRASYFYTNASYVIGSASLVALVGMLVLESRRSRVFCGAALLAFTGTLFIMFQKTALVAFTGAALVGWALARRRPRAARPQGRSGRYALLAAAALAAAGLLYNIAGTSEYYEFEASSLLIRFTVYASTLGVLGEHPERLLVGFGPESSTRLSGDVVDAARRGSEGIEGAIDSAYLTFLFEHGVVFLILLLQVGGQLMHALLVRLDWGRRLEPTGATLLLILVFVALSAVSQVLGVSKVAWVVVQLLALAGAHLEWRDSESRAGES